MEKPYGSLYLNNGMYKKAIQLYKSGDCRPKTKRGLKTVTTLLNFYRRQARMYKVNYDRAISYLGGTFKSRFYITNLLKLKCMYTIILLLFIYHL